MVGFRPLNCRHSASKWTPKSPRPKFIAASSPGPTCICQNGTGSHVIAPKRPKWHFPGPRRAKPGSCIGRPLDPAQVGTWILDRQALGPMSPYIWTLHKQAPGSYTDTWTLHRYAVQSCIPFCRARLVVRWCILQGTTRRTLVYSAGDEVRLKSCGRRVQRAVDEECKKSCFGLNAFEDS